MIRKLPIGAAFTEPMEGTIVSLWKYPPKLKAFTVHPQVAPLMGDIPNIKAFKGLKEKLRSLHLSPFGDGRGVMKSIETFLDKEEAALKK